MALVALVARSSHVVAPSTLVAIVALITLVTIVALVALVALVTHSSPGNQSSP